MTESPLLTRAEAAAYLRVSLRTFERQVQPRLSMVRIGGRFFTTTEDLDRWLAAQKLPSTSAPVTAGHGSTAESPGVATVKRSAFPSLSERARRNVELLKKPARASTPSSSPGASPRRMSASGAR